MIIDVTGIELTPGNLGKDCLGNGEHGECCCDECDYYRCCINKNFRKECKKCTDTDCPRKAN